MTLETFIGLALITTPKAYNKYFKIVELILEVLKLCKTRSIPIFGGQVIQEPFSDKKFQNLNFPQRHGITIFNAEFFFIILLF